MYVLRIEVNIKQNIENVKLYCKEVIKFGALPIAPHLYFPQFLHDEKEHERCLGIDFGLDLLTICDEIWVYGNPTEGMKKEIEYAQKLKKIIVFKLVK